MQLAWPWSVPRLPFSRPVRPNSLMLTRSEEHTSELQSQSNLVCRLLLEKKKKKTSLLQPHIFQRAYLLKRKYDNPRVHSQLLNYYCPRRASEITGCTLIDRLNIVATSWFL